MPHPFGDPTCLFDGRGKRRLDVDPASGQHRLRGCDCLGNMFFRPLHDVLEDVVRERLILLLEAHRSEDASYVDPNRPLDRVIQCAQ